VGSAVCSIGILMGGALPTALTTPVGVLPLAHGDWRWALASWSALVLLSAIAIGVAAPSRASLPSGTTNRWWPDWRQNQTIRIGLVMGMASATYFGANAYIPDFPEQTGRHGLTSPTLDVLNG